MMIKAIQFLLIIGLHTLAGRDQHYERSKTPRQIRWWLEGLLTLCRILPTGSFFIETMSYISNHFMIFWYATSRLEIAEINLNYIRRLVT